MRRTVLITGASGKLGSAISRHLAPLGWDFVLTSRESSRCEPLAKELRDTGAAVHIADLDLLCANSVETLAKRLSGMGVTLTHMVSNARSLDTLVLGDNGLAQAQPFIDEFIIDVVGPYRVLMSLACDPRHSMRAAVAVGSQYGEIGPNPALYEGSLIHSPIQYGVAKAALHHMTRELAIRLAPRVRVNCVAFGGFVGRADPTFQERYGRMLPLGRMLTERDAGGPVAFLLDDAASSAVTGHVLMADGGWSIW